MAFFKQRSPRNEMVRALAQNLMQRPTTPAYGAAGAITNFGAPIAGALLGRAANQQQQKQRQAETSAMGRLLAEAEKARTAGTDPMEAVNRVLAEQQGQPGYAAAGEAFMQERVRNLASTLGATAKPETFGAPIEAVGPGGETVFVRPGNLGTMREVAGFTPVPEEAKAPKFQTALGKTFADIDAAEATYGKDSPQVRALREAATAESRGEPPDIKDEAGQRKEFTKGSGDFIAVRDAFEKVKAARGTAEGDLAMIFNYMKMLDPGSVVREGEFATAQNTAGVPERLRNVYNRLLSGERLAPSQRQGFKDQAGDIFSAQKRQQDLLEREYRQLARDSGLRPDNVVIDYQGDLRSYGAAPSGEETAPETPVPPDIAPDQPPNIAGARPEGSAYTTDELLNMTDDDIRKKLGL